MSSLPPDDDDKTIVRSPAPAEAAGAEPPAAPQAATQEPAAPAQAYPPTAIEPRIDPSEAPTELAVHATPLPPARLEAAPAPMPMQAGATGAGAVPSSAPGSAASSAGKSGNALPVGTYIGEFEVLGVVGEGGFGIVYSAQDHSLQRRVALKEYMPAQFASRTNGSQVQVRSEYDRPTFDLGMRSFINEARLLASFDHPSLVKVYRFWESNGTAYMVMQFVEGITLKDKLRLMGQPPDEAWLLDLLDPLTEALAVIHAENCFHRDIAPDNVILLSGSERPLLLDFGAARRVLSDKAQALTVILKPGYAPIEQYAEVADMNQGPWTDAYALASTVHYAITGKTPPAAVSRMLEDSYKPLETVAAGRYSPGFLQAIDKALRVRPEDRTASMSALRSDLGLPPPSLSAEPQRAPAASGRQTTVAPIRQAPPPAPDASGKGGSVAAPQAAAAKGGKGMVLAGIAGVVVVAGATAAFLMSGPAKQTAPSAAQGAAVTSSGTAPNVASTAASTTVTAAPTSAPQAQSARKPFEIRDEFDKVLAGQSAGFKIDASPRQATLGIGRDKLSFTVKSSRDGFVQVLVLGPDGSLVMLFPNAQASDNAIKAGQTMTLPQPKWQLDTVEPAGSESFLVIVSAQPRDYSDLSKERDYIFLKLPTGRNGAEAAARWTRSTPMLLGGLKSCPTPDCEAYGAAAFSVNIVH